MTNNSGSINLNKVIFDEKQTIGQPSYDKAELLVLDGETVVGGKTTQSGDPVHPVRRIKALDFRDWVGGGGNITTFNDYTFRAAGQVVSADPNDGVKFVVSVGSDVVTKLGLTADNLGAAVAHIVGKTTSGTPVLASMTWKYNGAYDGAYFTDVYIPLTSQEPEQSVFLMPITTTIEDITVTMTFNSDNITVTASHLNFDSVKWAMYITFYPVEIVQS